MTHPEPIPFGPETKDAQWRWGAFLVGIAAFAALVWIATLGDIDLIGWWWVFALLLGGLFSIRSGRAWSRGEAAVPEPSHGTPTALRVSGAPGSTYVILDGGRGRHGVRVRPRELSPFWWALYSLVVRAPVALGDFVLTLAWRVTGGVGGGSGVALRRSLERDHERADLDDSFVDPDRERF